jgi:uncharacterized protein (TIGR02147 family)
METGVVSGSSAAADYRVLLGEKYRAFKAGDRKFSQRFISRRLGIASAGWFADVLAGRQKLKPRHIAPIAALFRLQPAEKALLRVLVDLESAETSGEKNAAYARWLELQGLPRAQIARTRFRYFEHWYYPVLRELLPLLPEPVDPAALGAALHPPLSPAKTREALRTLVELGLTNPDAPAPTPVLVKEAARTPHWSRILESYLKLAVPALKTFDKDERDFSGLTIALSPESLREAGEEIAALRRRLLALSEKDAGKNRVYQCLFQIFPVSKTMEIPHV